MATTTPKPIPYRDLDNEGRASFWASAMVWVAVAAIVLWLYGNTGGAIVAYLLFIFGAPLCGLVSLLYRGRIITTAVGGKAEEVEQRRARQRQHR